MAGKNIDQLRSDLSDAVRTFQDSVDALDQAVADHLRINRTDLRCLAVLLQMGSASPGQLGTALKMTTGSVTAMLDRLEKLHYLSRSPDPDDRRKLRIKPTQKFTNMAAKVYEPLARASGGSISRYSREELEILLTFLADGRKVQEDQLARIQEMKSPPRVTKKGRGLDL
jgi:DNA-binding MarR family transcriptional regulator